MATFDDTREILCVGDLIQDGIYRLHSRSRLAVHLTDGVRVVSVVPRLGDAGPLTLRLRDPDALRVRSVTIEGRSVLLDGRRLRLEGVPTYRSALAFDPADLARLQRSLALLGSLLAELAPERSLAFLIDPDRMFGLREGPDRRTAEHIGHCVRDILSWDAIRGVRRLGGRSLASASGCGFVGGLLVAMNIIERAGGGSLAPLRRLVFEEARTRDVVTDALLYAAAEGFVSESINELISAMSRGAAGDVRRSAQRLVSVGGCLGADAAVGTYMTLRSRLRVCSASGRLTPTGASHVRRADARWS